MPSVMTSGIFDNRLEVGHAIFLRVQAYRLLHKLFPFVQIWPYQRSSDSACNTPFSSFNSLEEDKRGMRGLDLSNNPRASIEDRFPGDKSYPCLGNDKRSEPGLNRMEPQDLLRVLPVF